MKKPVLYLSILMALLTACQPDKADFPEQDDSKNKVDSYQPLSPGSTWTYRLESADGIDTVTHTMLATTKEFNKKTYFEVDARSGEEVSQGYYYNLNHVYSLREENDVVGAGIEMVYLNDAATVGYTWTNAITDDGLLNGVPARMKGVIVERNINRSVLGRVYTKVIYTRVELQYYTANKYTTMATYNFYAAKGVGLIEIDTDLNGDEIATTQLLDYSIMKK